MSFNRAGHSWRRDEKWDRPAYDPGHQITRADLRTMSAADIVAAQNAGRVLDIGDGVSDADIEARRTSSQQQAQAEERRFAGSADSGTRGPARRPPPHIARDDLKRMTPEEIVQAHRNGDLDHLTG